MAQEIPNFVNLLFETVKPALSIFFLGEKNTFFANVAGQSGRNWFKFLGHFQSKESETSPHVLPCSVNIDISVCINGTRNTTAKFSI